MFAPHAAPPDARGYGAEHRAERARVGEIVAAGAAVCSICSRPIRPGAAWHLDHAPDRQSYRGAAHASCNAKDGARRGARAAAKARRARRRYTPPGRRSRS
jgi:hypothetical protein